MGSEEIIHPVTSRDVLRRLLYRMQNDKLTMWGNKFDRKNTWPVIQKALEKQVPKTPNYEGDGYDNEGNMIYDTYICPNCDAHFEVDYEEYNYCPICGQKLELRN